MQAELQRFGDALLRCKIQDSTRQSPPRLSFQNLAGDVMEIQWKPLSDPLKDECRVNGKPLKLSSFPLLHCTHAQQPSGGALTLQLPAGKQVTYDFKAWKIIHSAP